jgi:Tfp pilus assembly protein PilF
MRTRSCSKEIRDRCRSFTRSGVSGQNLERGEECLRRYLEHEPGPDEPSLASAHYRLGVLYEKSGSRELARREYSAALEIEPSLADAREALKKIS